MGQTPCQVGPQQVPKGVRKGAVLAREHPLLCPSYGIPSNRSNIERHLKYMAELHAEQSKPGVDVSTDLTSASPIYIHRPGLCWRRSHERLQNPKAHQDTRQRPTLTASQSTKTLSSSWAQRAWVRLFTSTGWPSMCSPTAGSAGCCGGRLSRV